MFPIQITEARHVTIVDISENLSALQQDQEWFSKKNGTTTTGIKDNK